MTCYHLPVTTPLPPRFVTTSRWKHMAETADKPVTTSVVTTLLPPILAGGNIGGNTISSDTYGQCYHLFSYIGRKSKKGAQQKEYVRARPGGNTPHPSPTRPTRARGLICGNVQVGL